MGMHVTIAAGNKKKNAVRYFFLGSVNKRL